MATTRKSRSKKAGETIKRSSTTRNSGKSIPRTRQTIKGSGITEGRPSKPFPIDKRVVFGPLDELTTTWLTETTQRLVELLKSISDESDPCVVKRRCDWAVDNLDYWLNAIYVTTLGPRRTAAKKTPRLLEIADRLQAGFAILLWAVADFHKERAQWIASQPPVNRRSDSAK